MFLKYDFQKVCQIGTGLWNARNRALLLLGQIPCWWCPLCFLHTCESSEFRCCWENRWICCDWRIFILKQSIKKHHISVFLVSAASVTRVKVFNANFVTFLCSSLSWATAAALAAIAALRLDTSLPAITCGGTQPSLNTGVYGGMNWSLKCLLDLMKYQWNVLRHLHETS